MSRTFSESEKIILGIVQDNLPDSAEPYADIAGAANVSEEFVINFLKSLRQEGAIRRFGASIKHQRTGWTHNAMVAWLIDDDKIDAAGEFAAKNQNISHCYHRPSPYPDWPYTLYTMIHGRNAQECLDVIEDLRKNTDLDEYDVLESVSELKKISMTYFEKV